MRAPLKTAVASWAPSFNIIIIIIIIIIIRILHAPTSGNMRECRINQVTSGI